MTRSRATAKQAGTRWETSVVNALIATGWPYAERRRLSGSADKGDVAGIPGICLELKDAARTDLAGWLAEAHKERDNAGAKYGFVWFKRRGKASPLDGYVLMDGAQLVVLLKEAGY